MANIYRKVNTDLIAATVNTAYTVPDNSRAIIKSIHVYNNGAGAADVTIGSDVRRGKDKVVLVVWILIVGDKHIADIERVKPKVCQNAAQV